MTIMNLGDFQREVDCLYGNETYSVRDNGAVLRHHRDGKRRRALDKRWVNRTCKSTASNCSPVADSILFCPPASPQPDPTFKRVLGQWLPPDLEQRGIGAV